MQNNNSCGINNSTNMTLPYTDRLKSVNPLTPGIKNYYYKKNY